MDSNDNTAVLRHELRNIDQHIALLLQERFSLIQELREKKRGKGMAIEQPGEWQKKREYLTSLLTECDAQAFILQLFDAIHEQSIRYQQTL